MQFEDLSVRANGLSHHVLRWDGGGGETIVLCHGFLDLALSFEPLASALAELGHRVVAFDFRGHGDTDRVGPGGYYHFADYVRDLAALLRALELDRPHLVGHSMGGTVVALYAGTFPERVPTVTLLEGLGPETTSPDQAPDRMRAWLEGVERVEAAPPSPLDDVEAALARMRRANPDLPERLGPALAARATRPYSSDPSDPRRVFAFDPLHRTRSPLGFRVDAFRAFLSRLAMPTLVVLGEHGYRVPDGEERLAALPRARVVTLPATAHMMHWTAPAAIAELVDALVRSRASSG